MSNQVGDYFKFLWPFQNFQTLPKEKFWRFFFWKIWFFHFDRLKKLTRKMVSLVFYDPQGYKLSCYGSFWSWFFQFYSNCHVGHRRQFRVSKQSFWPFLFCPGSRKIGKKRSMRWLLSFKIYIFNVNILMLLQVGHVSTSVRTGLAGKRFFTRVDKFMAFYRMRLGKSFFTIFTSKLFFTFVDSHMLLLLKMYMWIFFLSFIRVYHISNMNNFMFFQVGHVSASVVTELASKRFFTRVDQFMAYIKVV